VINGEEKEERRKGKGGGGEGGCFVRPIVARRDETITRVFLKVRRKKKKRKGKEEGRRKKREKGKGFRDRGRKSSALLNVSVPPIHLMRADTASI